MRLDHESLSHPKTRSMYNTPIKLSLLVTAMSLSLTACLPDEKQDLKVEDAIKWINGKQVSTQSRQDTLRNRYTKKNEMPRAYLK